MALNPSYLDNCPAAAVALWQECEDEILKDMARRIQKTDFFTPATLWQQNRLQTASKTKQEIVKTLAKYTGYSQAVIKQMMLDAGNISIKQDLAVISQADIYKASKIDKAALNAVLRSGAAQTNQTMINICKTMAVTATKQFEKALDNAWMQVASGAFDINTAIDRACKSLADAGITAIDYGKRKDTIETAVRRAVRTGVNQTSLKITEELCDEVGCDLVEVSAHDGARPDHAVWQGQIYSRSGNSKKYPSFSKTGYGTGAGLGGWNCRHSFGPYVEGGNRIWDDQQLEDYKAKKYHYNGVDMTTYEATQYQRALERQLRKYKREKIAGVEGAEQKIVAANKEMNDFLDTIGLKRLYDRETIFDKSYDEILSAKEWSKHRITNKDTVVKFNYTSAEFRRKFDTVDSDKRIASELYNSAKSILEHRTGTLYEDMVYINSTTYITRSQTGYEKVGECIPTKRMKDMLLKSGKKQIVAMHNHPRSMMPSLEDLKAALHYKYGIIICHNGTIIKYTVAENYEPDQANFLLDILNKAYYNVPKNVQTVKNTVEQISEAGVIVELIE